MGRPMPGYRVLVLDADGMPQTEGEICLDLNDERPAGLMQGYADAAGTLSGANDKVYRTGDVANLDEDGYLTFVGRADDVFKSSDYRISPFELESVLIEHEAVAEAAIVPSPDDIRLSVPKAYILLIASARAQPRDRAVDPEIHQPAAGALQAHPPPGVRQGTAQDDLRQDPAQPASPGRVRRHRRRRHARRRVPRKGRVLRAALRRMNFPDPASPKTLARFVVDTKWEDIPERARHEAKRSLLNFFAVAIAGCRTEPVELALKTLGEFSGGKQATIVGRTRAHRRLERRLPQRRRRQRLRLLRHAPADGGPSHRAARPCPAGAGRAAARDGTGAAAGLRAGLRDRMPGRRRRLARPLSQGLAHHLDLRRVRRRGRRRQAAGARQRIRSCGRWAPPRHSRRASANAWAGRPRASASAMPRAMACSSALLAEKGFSGPAEPIAGAQGWLAAMGEPPNWAALTDGLGKSWEVLDNSLKPYPAGFVIHPLLDCALDWRRQNPGVDGRAGVGARQSPAAAAHRPARGRDRTRKPGQPAARRRRRAGAGQGRARSVHRRLRRRSRGQGDAAQDSRWRAILRSRPSPSRWISGRPTARSTASRPRPRAAARPIR